MMLTANNDCYWFCWFCINVVCRSISLRGIKFAFGIRSIHFVSNVLSKTYYHSKKHAKPCNWTEAISSQTAADYLSCKWLIQRQQYSNLCIATGSSCSILHGLRYMVCFGFVACHHSFFSVYDSESQIMWGQYYIKVFSKNIILKSAICAIL